MRRQPRELYFASFSARTLIYKGMLSAEQMEMYFPDLVDPRIESALAVVHQRFSTNTFPSWSLAHPFRYISHNGEINTLRGNINWMKAREALFESELFGEDVKDLLPVIVDGGSDSAMFDNALEMLVMCGRSLPHAMMMLIPEAWDGHETMSDEKKAFYEYHSCLMEPWDGPASMVFTDGVVIGATLDRNGLRPSRYCVTKDGLVVMASEVGVLDIPPENILLKGRLQPGKMFLIDTREGRIIDDAELKHKIATEKPYRQWLNENLVRLADLPAHPVPEPDHATVLLRQQVFGYTHEDLRILMAPMAKNGEEAIGSMGTDTPLAVLSDRAAAAVQLFQATVRAGDESAARRHSRRAGHVHVDGAGPGTESVEAGTRKLPDDQNSFADHGQRRSGETAPHLCRRVPLRDASDVLQSIRRRRRACGARWMICLRRRRIAIRVRRNDSDSVRSAD